MATAPWHIWPDLHLVLNYFKVDRSDRCLFLEAFRATQADAIPCFVSRDIIYWDFIRSLIPLCCDLVVLYFKEISESLEQNCPSASLQSWALWKWISKQGVAEYVISSCCPSQDCGGGTVWISWWLDTGHVGRQPGSARSTPGIRKWPLWTPEDDRHQGQAEFSSPGVEERVHSEESRSCVGNGVGGLTAGLERRRWVYTAIFIHWVFSNGKGSIS